MQTTLNINNIYNLNKLYCTDNKLIILWKQANNPNPKIKKKKHPIIENRYKNKS